MEMVFTVEIAPVLFLPHGRGAELSEEEGMVVCLQLLVETNSVLGPRNCHFQQREKKGKIRRLRPVYFLGSELVKE